MATRCPCPRCAPPPLEPWRPGDRADVVLEVGRILARQATCPAGTVVRWSTP